MVVVTREDNESCQRYNAILDDKRKLIIDYRPSNDISRLNGISYTLDDIADERITLTLEERYIGNCDSEERYCFTEYIYLIENNVFIGDYAESGGPSVVFDRIRDINPELMKKVWRHLPSNVSEIAWRGFDRYDEIGIH